MIPQTIEEYQHCVEKFRTEKISISDIEKYNPDNMDNATFWRESIEKFGLIPICGAVDLGELDKNIANYYNALLATYVGAYNLLDGHFLSGEDTQRIKLLDIGAGFGSLAQYIQIRQYNIDYYGIDINNYANCDRVYVCNGNSIPDELGEDFDYVFSCNVFQHLSVSQRDSYYREAWRVLKPRGKLTVSFTCTTQNIERRNGEDDNSYIWTAGQYTQLESVNTVTTKIQNVGFNILSTSIRYMDGYFTIHALKP